MENGMKVAICILDDNDNIKAKHELQSVWNSDLEHAVKLINIDIYDEMGRLLLDTIIKEFGMREMSNLIREAKDNS